MKDKMKDRKNHLRRKLLYTRKHVSKAQRDMFDKKIAQQLFELPEFKTCPVVLCYVSFDDEVSTDEIVEYCLSHGKVLAVPRCIKDSIELKFHVVSSRDDLEIGEYGIMEPLTNCPELVETHNSICIVPCLSVDDRGYRLGYGKGYYDRFLAGFNGVSVGICYDILRSVSELIVDEYDVPLDFIITDKTVFRAK